MHSSQGMSDCSMCQVTNRLPVASQVDEAAAKVKIDMSLKPEALDKMARRIRYYWRRTLCFRG